MPGNNYTYIIDMQLMLSTGAILAWIEVQLQRILVHIKYILPINRNINNILHLTYKTQATGRRSEKSEEILPRQKHFY